MKLLISLFAIAIAIALFLLVIIISYSSRDFKLLMFRAGLSEGDVFRTRKNHVHQVTKIHDDLVYYAVNGESRVIHINQVYPLD